MGFSRLLLALPFVLFGCGPGHKPPQPPKFDPEGQTTCKIRTSQSKPLIVEWPSAERVQLEARARRGLVVVRYNGCEMELLTRCQAPGAYEYSAVTPKRDSILIRNEDDLYAQMPMGAVKLEGKLAQMGQLDVQMTMVGTYIADRERVDASELSGSCTGATHVVAGLTVGAFQFSAGSESEAGGGADVAGFGAGGRSKAKKETLATDGDTSACSKSTRSDQAPPENCSALLRLEVFELGGAVSVASKKTAPSSAAASAPSGGPDAALALFMRAANSGDEYEVQQHVSGECWSGNCRSFADQAGKKFQVKPNGRSLIRGERATVLGDIVINGEVKDRVYIYLAKTSGQWRVVDIDENSEHARTFLAEVGPVTKTQSTPADAVNAYFKAAKARNKDAMLGLFTQEAQQKERDWNKSFTNAMFSEGLKIKEWVVREVDAQGESANVSVKATFITPDGKEDGEGMRFVLARQNGKWWIIELK
jgi:hypothetical protein